jgi:hypothetical protein
VASPLEASPESLPEACLESILEWDREGVEERPLFHEFGDLRRDEIPFELDRALATRCRERGPLRAVLARIADRLVSIKGWERLGYARLADYAAECLGISARSVRSLARVGRSRHTFPALEEALVSGTLGWTKVRLLARLSPEEDMAAWVAHARHATAEELSREVRAVDRGSIEAGAAEEEGARSGRFEVRCRPEVRWKWNAARGAARRAAGRMLHPSEAAELIAAEVLSALPIDPDAEGGRCEETRVRPPAGVGGDAPTLGLVGPELTARAGEGGGEAPAADTAVRPPRRPQKADSTDQGAGTASSRPRCPASSLPRAPLPGALRDLVEGLEETDAFEVDLRLQRAVSMEQRLDAHIGPLLVLAWPRRVHRALGYRTREAYARERLGLDPTRARSLVRLERAVVESEPLAHAYRSGALSSVRASVLAPLVSADPLGRFVGEWVAWAGRVTMRRLREDVEGAVTLSETDPAAFRRCGGLPPEATDREIGATEKEREGDLATATSLTCVGGNGSGDHQGGGNREIGATEKGAREHVAPHHWDNDPWPHHHPEPLKSAPEETCWARFIGPADIVQVFRAVLCSVRRRMGEEDGRLPTEGEALGAMLDHVLFTWGTIDGKTAKRHKVFARDGWRCAVPGCTSMQNLHDHHIRFRSAQGSDDLDNRITLCAFHHLRGVHAGLLRCMGRAPDGLRWEMGIRPGITPRLAYRSGDIRISATASAR